MYHIFLELFDLIGSLRKLIISIYLLSGSCLIHFSGYGGQVREHTVVGCNNWIFFLI